jgi:hypothetical protein
MGEAVMDAVVGYLEGVVRGAPAAR